MVVTLTIFPPIPECCCWRLRLQDDPFCCVSVSLFWFGFLGSADDDGPVEDSSTTEINQPRSPARPNQLFGGQKVTFSNTVPLIETPSSQNLAAFSPMGPADDNSAVEMANFEPLTEEDSIQHTPIIEEPGEENNIRVRNESESSDGSGIK